ncbi:MAG: CpXC domain-containing protein [Methanocalculaceae archaeon]|jgi:hypothetical protein|nr:CpXC domain-containing protein [Methanocalculaceae archaeon]
MESIVKTIICPKCGKKQNFIMYPSVNVSLDPDLADKYLDGNLSILTCEDCGFSGIVEYPILYYDIEKKFSIFFSPDKTDHEAKIPDVLPVHLLPGMCLRLVHSSDDLREKIFIFRDLLDDRVVEIVKDSILREMNVRHEAKIPDYLYYAQDMFDCENRFLIFVPKKDEKYLGPIKIPFGTYEKIKMLMRGIWDRPIEGYTVVDKHWVQSAAK